MGMFIFSADICWGVSVMCWHWARPRQCSLQWADVAPVFSSPRLEILRNLAEIIHGKALSWLLIVLVWQTQTQSIGVKQCWLCSCADRPLRRGGGLVQTALNFTFWLLTNSLDPSPGGSSVFWAVIGGIPLKSCCRGELTSAFYHALLWSLHSLPEYVLSWRPS